MSNRGEAEEEDFGDDGVEDVDEVDEVDEIVQAVTELYKKKDEVTDAIQLVTNPGYGIPPKNILESNFQGVDINASINKTVENNNYHLMVNKRLSDIQSNIKFFSRKRSNKTK